MSQWARQQTLDSHQVPSSKVIAVGWGPCAVNLSEEGTLADAQREPIVLHVSNDFHRKGVDFLIATAERVCAAIPKARFLVIGRDSSGFNVPHNTRAEFLGPVYGADLANLFRKSSLFFLPHRFDRSPHVLVEAMSASLPLVASAQGGAIEVIKDRDTGILCTPGAVNEYSDAIIALLRDPDMQRRMGKKGLALMKARYNWPTIARLIADSIESTLRLS
jgi:phosphatidylinositol alpha-1,6-mannosyltransferase